MVFYHKDTDTRVQIRADPDSLIFWIRIQIINPDLNPNP